MLEQLRLLSNCESDQAKLLQIVLVGTPALEGLCQSEDMQHLARRIARRCRLRPLTRDEVGQYIENRLMVAALAPDEFAAPAVNAIAAFSDGIPRSVNLLCERSLDIARRRGVSPINAAIVRRAARQLNVSNSRSWFLNKRRAVVASVLLVGVPPATWLCASQGARMTASASVAPVSTARSAGSSNGAVASAAAVIPVLSDEVASGTLSLADGLTIQVAAFREADRAAAAIQQLRAAGLPAFGRIERAKYLVGLDCV